VNIGCTKLLATLTAQVTLTVLSISLLVTSPLFFFYLSALENAWFLDGRYSSPIPVTNVCRCKFVFSHLYCVKPDRVFSFKPNILLTLVASDFLELTVRFLFRKTHSLPFPAVQPCLSEVMFDLIFPAKSKATDAVVLHSNQAEF
jgi:hypothetical protein